MTGDLKLVERRAKLFFTGVHDAHDWGHVQRVRNLAIHIAQKEKANIDIVAAAALLHDIAREKQKNNEVKCHAEAGAEMCVPILQEAGFDDDSIKQIQHCIAVHRYSKDQIPKSKEGKILQDADRLDSLGAIGITRVISFGSTLGRPIYDPEIPPMKHYNGKSETAINHFIEKHFNIKPETFKTTTAQEIAKHRYAITKNFVREFLDEWNGKR